MQLRLFFIIRLIVVFSIFDKYGAAGAAPIAYNLPPETVAFAPAPNRELAMNNCTGCHSADYISTQPRGEKFGREFWRTEVTKMIKVYGAPIADSDVLGIAEYLAEAYRSADP